MSEFIKGKEYYDINGRLCKLIDVLSSGEFLVQYGVVFEYQEEERIEANCESCDEYHSSLYASVEWEELLNITDKLFINAPKYVYDELTKELKQQQEIARKAKVDAEKALCDALSSHEETLKTNLDKF